LRVVNIEDTDVEACCGTHCDNTSEVGWIKVIRTNRIQDGIVRVYIVAGEKVLDILNKESLVLNNLNRMWGISTDKIIDTAARIFNDYKKF